MSVYFTCVVTLDLPYAVALSQRKVPVTCVFVWNEAVALMVTLTITGTPRDRSPVAGSTRLIFAVVGTFAGSETTTAMAFEGTSTSYATAPLRVPVELAGNPVVTSTIAPFTRKTGSDSHHWTPSYAPRPRVSVERPNASVKKSLPNANLRSRPIYPPHAHLIAPISTK